MIKISIPLLALALIASACKPGEWRFDVTNYDLRTAQTAAQGSANGRAVHTMLSVICRPGPEGTVSINYTVYNTDNAGGFNFDSFEGPDAPASLKKLLDIDVETAAGIINIKTAVSGSYIENKAFTFSMIAMNTGRSGVRTIAEALANGAKAIRITVHDMNAPPITIRTDFPASNARAVIEKTIKGCCKDSSRS